MRTSRAIFNDLIDAAGRSAIAAALDVSESQTYKITEGERGIRPEDLDDIFTAAAQSKDAAAPALELLAKLGHLIGARIVTLDVLYEIEGMMLAMKNGVSHRSVMETCPDCRGPVKVVGRLDGFFVYKCENKDCPGKIAAAPVGAQLIAPKRA